MYNSFVTVNIPFDFYLKNNPYFKHSVYRSLCSVSVRLQNKR